MPVIISDQCGIQEFVAGQVGLVIPLEKSALVEALRKLSRRFGALREIPRGVPRCGGAIKLDATFWGTQEEIYARVLLGQEMEPR